METKGVVFDIQRFALHDGPGIRTTVFLKGCPLRCLWCHNPESQSFKCQLSFNKKWCVNCLRCTEACKYGVHKEVGGNHAMDFSLCRLCGGCVPECVSGALKIIGREISVDELIYEVKKDMDYYKNTHGGMTLSGGEPMSQFSFSLEIFKAAKEHGISTCLDTCGYAGREQYEEILPYTDIFLFDYKESDIKKHKDYTGVSNEIILSNLEFLCAKKCYVILRCPIVPGLNDYAGHFRKIAAIGKKYTAIAQIEIMTYHNFGCEKAKQIGQKSCDVPSGTVDIETGEKWAALVRSYGYEKVCIG